MLNRLKTAAQGGPGDVSGGSSVDGSGKWGRKNGGRPAERDQFRVQQQGFYVRGDLTVDIFQARGLRVGTAGERNPYCVVLVDRVKVGETLTVNKTLSPVWNQPIQVLHETVRRAADTNAWPVPYQPLSIQVWDRSSTSDTLLGTARVPITEVLGNGDGSGWYRLVGTGEQPGVEEICGRILVKVHWESDTLASTPEDFPRLFLRDVFEPDHKDYRHLYYGGLCSTMLCPPPGEEVLFEMMLGISRHDITANNHGRGVEGMLILTELRLLFLPDVTVGSATTSFLEFNTVQVYLAAVRNFSHRGLEGGARLLSITTRDGRFVHFRMPAAASSARCAAWFGSESPRQTNPSGGGVVNSPPAESGRVELWRRGLWGAVTSELWMERLVDEIRWRKTSGDFVALWHKLRETSSSPKPSKTRALPNSAVAASTGVASSSVAAKLAAAASSALSKGDLADGCAALERDLKRVGVPAADGFGASNYTALGRQMWEFKTVNKNYALSRTYPEMLAFPSSITPAQLTTAAPQRSRCRVPALVWLHPASRAPLCRSSQPMSGMTTKVLSEDIYLLKAIRVTIDTSKISIVDARPILNAKANQVTGKGYEDVNDIGRDVCSLGFMGIENIHTVRDSLAAFCAASQAQGQEYYHAVGASGWLRHLSQIMKGAAFVVDELQRGVAVLVHCSDGWDRTAQLTALAQLYMDPYYRTLEGFEVLVEKEWCSFGHMFGLRAHSDSPTESSPVFLQWLDAVWQLVRQYPSSFEFTGHYLERIVEGLYSAGFLNFAGNSERERKEKLKELNEAGSGALSLFTYLRQHAMEGHMTAPMLNPLYRPSADNLAGANGRAPVQRAVDILRPCCELQGLEIWQQVYMRDNLLLHHREQQLSVEQGLRLQVYDYQRRFGLVEANMGRLPRGLKTKMQASATGMSSPDWDQHDRLVDQLAADRDAAITEAFAPAPAGSSVGVTSRGRSQNRHSRVENNDDSSRSRSQSLNFPIRGWGAGRAGAQDERGKRWASQDSDTYQRGSRVDTDIEQERSRGIGESNPLDSSDVTGSGGGVDQVTDDENDLDERPSRSRSFFVGFGKWGIRRRREGSRAEMNSPRGRAGDDHMYSGNEGTMERVKGGSTAGADVGGQNMDGGGGSTRRRKGPSKRSENSRSRNNRFSSFTGEQPGGASSDAVEPGSASTLTPNLARKTSVKLRTAEDGRALRSHSMVDAHSPTVVPAPAQSARYLGGKSGWGRGKTTVRTKTEIEPKSRQRVLSAEAEPLAETPRNKTQAKSSRLMTPGRGRRGRSRAKSSAEVEDQEEGFGRRRRALSSATATATGEGNGAASSNSAINNSRSKSSSSTAPVTREAVTNEDGGAGGGKPKMGVFKRTRGVWESLQRSIGGGPSVRTSPEPSDGWRSRTPGRTRRRTPTPTPAEGTSAPISTVSSARNEKATEDAAAAERAARLLKAEEGAEAETRRQMQHKIVHLEMKLLVKEVVDMACLRAAEKASEQSNDRSRTPSNRSLLKIAPLSLSSSVAPEPLPRLSATALQPEQQTFFGKFWTSSAGGASTDLENADGGGGGFGGGRGGGGVAGHWGGPDGQGARLARRHSNLGLESETSAIWKGWGAQDSYHTDNTGKGDVQEEKDEEEGFFQVLRRKIFEGDKEEPEKKPPQKAEAGGAQKRASPFRSNSTSEMPASLKITPVRPGAPPSAAVNDSLGLGGGGSGPRLRGRSRSMAGAGEARVRADSGRGSYSPLVNIPPLPQAAGTRSANHPDAAAGGICCIQSATSASSTVADSKMGPDGAEAAAAKFGLVRMDLSKS